LFPLLRFFCPDCFRFWLVHNKSKSHLLLILWLKIFSYFMFEIFSSTKHCNLDIAEFVLNYKHILLARPHEITDLQLPWGHQHNRWYFS
jgi:hypothetical protein